MLYRYNNKHPKKIIKMAWSAVFYHLPKIFLHFNNSYIYKKNLYHFYFIGETNKYLMIRGILLKSTNISLNPKQISHNKCICFLSRIDKEFTYFKIPKYLPTLHF